MNLRDLLSLQEFPCPLGVAVEAKIDGPQRPAVLCCLHECHQIGKRQFSAIVVDEKGSWYECDAQLIDLVELDGFWIY